MGLGPSILALYRQLKVEGAFEGVHYVIELGAQAVWCPKRKLVQALFDAFKCPAPTPEQTPKAPEGADANLAQ